MVEFWGLVGVGSFVAIGTHAVLYYIGYRRGCDKTIRDINTALYSFSQEQHRRNLEVIKQYGEAGVSIPFAEEHRPDGFTMPPEGLR